MLLLPEDPNCVVICVATGTGIAPFRSFWRRCFYEDVPDWKFTGLFWLFMGAANSDAKLYDDEITQMTATCAPPLNTCQASKGCLLGICLIYHESCPGVMLRLWMCCVIVRAV